MGYFRIDEYEFNLLVDACKSWLVCRRLRDAIAQALRELTYDRTMMDGLEHERKRLSHEKQHFDKLRLEAEKRAAESERREAGLIADLAKVVEENATLRLRLEESERAKSALTDEQDTTLAQVKSKFSAIRAMCQAEIDRIAQAQAAGASNQPPPEK